MLVLTRKVGEKIVIDGRIEVEVVEVRGDRIRLGITAPREIPVHRAEVVYRDQEELVDLRRRIACV